MVINIEIHPTATTRHQCSLVHLKCAGIVHSLDVDFDSFLKCILRPDPIALDLLFIASCAYGVDKAVSRDLFSEDKWTRHLDVTIPVAEPDIWGTVSDDMADCLGFLTGDRWSFQFAKSNRSLVQRRRFRRRRLRRYAPLDGEAVSLFSGGLDSFIGAIDFLAENPQRKLALIGQYDGDIGGPGKDQDNLAIWLEEAYPSRFTRLKCRIGLSEKAEEHSYRSRSFLFLALGVAAARSLGDNVPVIIPENGPIALNPPLIPSRRGACSTRTTHPHFLLSVESILHHVGLQHKIGNPYRFATKGEMIKNCKNSELLLKSYAESRSCAKAGRKTFWKNKLARQCGLCIPCLFRRAALHTVGWDDEQFGNDLGDSAICLEDVEKSAFADVRALSAFLLRNDPADKIRRELLTNGPILAQDLSNYVLVVQRMRDEVRSWMASKSTALIQKGAGFQVTS
jgi:hypothetical protein